LRRASLSELGRRLAHFWVVWSALLLVHEAGHAVGAWRQGLSVRRITVGAGPILWKGQRGSTEVVLRLVPIAGMTTFGSTRGTTTNHAAEPGGWGMWARELITIAGGVFATLALAFVVAGIVAVRELLSRKRWRWGRYVIADALVLTLFNFLPVPPLDGGRAVIGALAAWGDIRLTGDTLFWVQLGGLALAVVPMALWTQWTARIDAAALRWRAPAAP
jgi:membrane-associated protease RseP (regulator of RpoE activity)